MKLLHSQCPSNLGDALQICKVMGRYFSQLSQHKLEGFCTQVICNKSKFLYQEVAWISLMFMYELFMHLKQPRSEVEGLSTTPEQQEEDTVTAATKKYVFSSILTVIFLQKPDWGRPGHGKSLTQLSDHQDWKLILRFKQHRDVIRAGELWL